MQQPHLKTQHFQKRVCGLGAADLPHTLCVHISCKGTPGEDYIQTDTENGLELFLLKAWVVFVVVVLFL